MIHNIAMIGMFIVVGLVFWRLYEVWRDEQ